MRGVSPPRTGRVVISRAFPNGTISLFRSSPLSASSNFSPIGAPGGVARQVPDQHGSVVPARARFGRSVSAGEGGRRRVRARKRGHACACVCDGGLSGASRAGRSRRRVHHQYPRAADHGWTAPTSSARHPCCQGRLSGREHVCRMFCSRQIFDAVYFHVIRHHNRRNEP